MEIVVISAAALVVSCLTFFSGFGLGTILTPVFLLFFPVDVAIALTAIVHFLNNILKAVILFKYARWNVVLRFGFPAFIAAFFGAKALFFLERLPALYAYSFFGRDALITPVKLALTFLIVLFAVAELVPSFGKITFPPRFLPLGGVASGFFGGLSGHQGALRSMFLLKCGLSRENFIATGVIIVCIVDFSRIAVYWENLMKARYEEYLPLMMCAVLAAFTGVFVGSRLMKKVTMKTIQVIVAAMLFMIAVFLGAGII